MDSSSETQPGLIKLTGIVGIGASAGGLEALEELFTAMPAGTGLAFVVVQHLSPVFQSHMDELLARRTSLKIRVIEDGDQLRPDTIFLLPPRKVTKRVGNNLRLFDRPSDNVVSLPINIFFESLAEHVDPPIAAVVLSGTGSDGAIGIQAVHHVGGLVLSQSEKSAKFVGMPSKAVATQCVDLSLPPNLIAEALSIFARSANKHEVLEQLKASFGDAEYSSVFEILRDRYSLDFSQYKITTLHRRIRRRMQRIGYTDTTSYVQYLHDEPEEVTKLYQDFLIGVTQFFRDSDAFAELELRVIGPLAARAADDDEIRVWVAGCATGQEAYSVAMLLRDYLDQYEKKTHFRVFATDMHPESLRVASLGQYTAADMEMVPDTRRSRFFTKVGGSYQVCKELREHIVFATHNLISDPPFTNLDLVCCRNLLIYLDETAQESVLSYIHYGLKPNGSLFLGPSEVLGAAASAFEAIDQHSKLYTKVGAYLPAHHASISRSRPLTVRPQANIATSKRSMVDSSVLQCYDRLLDLFMPDSILVDSELSLVQTFGDAASILKIPRGRASTSVLDLLPEALRSVVAAGLRQAGRDRTIVRIEQLAEVNASVATTFRSVTVRPMVTTSGQPNYYLIEFQTSTVTATEPPPGIALIRGLEDEWDQVKLLKHELDYTRENLQATVEELETTNEELQTTNEELTSSNEELQSSNEELHSVNEELYTVNSEYQRKIKELTELTNDIQNLLSCSDVGVMFLDRDLMIRRFTPKIGELMGLRDSKLGEPVAVCDSLLPGIDLPGLCRSVMESGRPEHLELQGVRGVSLLLQVLPYEVKKSVTGIIVTLIDITGVKKTEREIVKLSAIVSSSDFAIVSCSVDGVIETWNHAAAELYGIDERKAVGSKLTEVFPPVLSNKIMPLFHAAAADSPTTDIEIEITVPKGASRTILTHVQGIRGKHTNISAVSLIFQDVTEQKAAALSLKLRTRAIEATINGIILVDALAPDQPIIYANQGFCRMTGYALEEILGRNCRFLQGPESDANAIATIRAAVHGGSECRCNIVNYRRDGSKFHNDLTISPIKDEDGRVTHFVGVQHDVTRLVEAERVLQSEIEYRAAFENAAVGMAKVSRQGKLLRVNDKLCQILGFTRRQLLASSLPELAHPDDAQACLDQLKDAADGSLALQSIELRLRHRSGHIIWSSITVSRHHVADLDQTACIALIQDISVRKHFEQELKASIHARETFLAMLSHELRNPLSAVLNAGRLAMRRAERNGQRPDEAFAIIERQAGHISKLLRDLLDVSRISIGKIELELTKVDLRTLVNDVIESVTPSIDEHNICIQAAMPDYPLWVLGDRERLHQIQVNLLSNAVKYSPHGGVVWFSLSVEDLHAVIRVKDSGIGVPSSLLQKVFDPFVQSDVSLHRSEGGLGLGLTLVKSLVELHRGTVQAKSEGTNLGSEFVVRLPRYIDAPAEMSATKRSIGFLRFDKPSVALNLPHHTPLRPLRIAIVEDQIPNARILKEHLELDGHAVEIAFDGQEGLRLITNDPPDVALLDIGLPGMDGYALAQAIREHLLERSPVLIAITGYGQTADVDHSVESGFSAHLMKPLDLVQLNQVLSAYFPSPAIESPNIV